MTKLGRSVCLVIAALALGLAPPAFAAESSDTKAFEAKTFDAKTKAAIQDVISQQLQAFSHEDAKGAEAFASPAIREKFPEADKFFAMVKENYAALVHPKSTQFGELSDSPHGTLQKMTIVSDDGTVWTAVYVLQQVDGTWRIGGCGLQKEADQQAI